MLYLLVLFLISLSAARDENPCIDNFSFRIFGGEAAQPGQFPFVVALRNESMGLWGAASILNENWLITAAHCVEGYTTANLSVTMSSNLLSSGAIPYNITSIIVNPNYDPLTAENDIALLKVSRKIPMDSLTQPIEIGVGSENDAGTVIGWGLVKWGTYPDELQFLPTRVTSVEECQSYWDTLVDTQICTLVGEGAGVCCGDSGGPLVAGGKLVGIVSYGIPCGVGAPDILTRVSSFTEWINEIIN